MPKKKSGSSRKSKSSSRKKPPVAARKSAAHSNKPHRGSASRRGGASGRTSRPIRGANVRPARSIRHRHALPREISSGNEKSSLGAPVLEIPNPAEREGTGSEAAGQSGDLQGLSRVEDSNSESVEELIEEGQSFEADAINGVENAPDADQGEVRTHERPQDEFFERPRRRRR